MDKVFNVYLGIMVGLATGIAYIWLAHREQDTLSTTMGLLCLSGLFIVVLTGWIVARK